MKTSKESNDQPYCQRDKVSQTEAGQQPSMKHDFNIQKPCGNVERNGNGNGNETMSVAGSGHIRSRRS
jgi:hypothetical protein